MATTGVGPRVGVASIIVSPDNRILIGKRKSSHGAGESKDISRDVYHLIFWP